MSEKILIVDDEPDIVELLAHNLTANGYEVLTAANGLEALNKARRYLPDLILLDLMLEGIDGYSVCEILRRQPSTSSVPVIMITALAGQIARANGIAAGADDFVTKPFSPQEVVSRVKRLLEIQTEKIRKMNSNLENAESSL